MVIDSSALLAILFREAEADSFTAAVVATPRRLVGAPSLLETAMVTIGRLGPTGRGLAERLIGSIAADIMAFTERQANRAVEAFLRYGKGRHRANLNFGGCCSYALAAETGLPLLIKGNDFAETDIRPAPAL
ncbi:MAG: type II toxin-antitoxin system VapC family toxin [Acetobacteraceae bacterium]